MARLDVYAMPGASGVGFLVDVQASILEFLDTRIVVPLLLAKGISPSPINDLNPTFEIDGQPHIMFTQGASAIRKRELRQKVTSLDSFHDQITKALDVLLLGS